MSAELTAVVVAHARTVELERLLTALREQTRPPDAVLIVDSDAQPAVRSLVDGEAARDERVEVLRLGRNGGSAGSFAAGLTAAAQRPGTTAIVAFDDDAVPAPDCVELLAGAFAREPGAGLVGAVSRDAGGELAWPMYVEGRREPVRTSAELEQVAAGRETLPVAELAWHALLVPVATLRRLGPPREELFMWYEDVEYGLRVRAAGLRTHVVPAASVEHPTAPTVHRRVLGVALDVPVVSVAKAYLMTRNALVVRHAYAGPRFWAVDLPLTLLRAGVAAAALPGRRWPVVREAVLRPVLDAARGRLGPPPASTHAAGRP